MGRERKQLGPGELSLFSRPKLPHHVAGRRLICCAPHFAVPTERLAKFVLFQQLSLDRTSSLLRRSLFSASSKRCSPRSAKRINHEGTDTSVDALLLLLVSYRVRTKKVWATSRQLTKNQRGWFPPLSNLWLGKKASLPPRCFTWRRLFFLTRTFTCWPALPM